MEWIPISISATTLAFVILAFWRSGGWHVADKMDGSAQMLQTMVKEVEQSIRSVLSEHQENDNAEFSSVRRSIDMSRRESGEMGAALRQKVNEVELYIRDYYLHKTSFERIFGSVTTDIKTMEEKIEARLLRMENKIDTKT